MREALVTGREVLRERLLRKEQLEAPVPEAAMPPYMESFLAHLRLLVGVPFDYLIPDERLLPRESIRFFYLDRSWTDRLVDGAVSVGKIGTREQAHHHAQHAHVRQQLDVTERGVRDLQRARTAFVDLKTALEDKSAGVVTGFLLRSGAVSGWPHMDVRAYSAVLERDFDPDAQESRDQELDKLRLERLSPSVLLALFEGVPQMVICEEPHHGVQFGVHEHNGTFKVFRRTEVGRAIETGGVAQRVAVPVRKSNPRVVAVADLWKELRDEAASDSTMPVMDGAASFAIEVLNLPWRQRFQGEGGKPDVTGYGHFVPYLTVAPRITVDEVVDMVKGYLK